MTQNQPLAEVFGYPSEDLSDQVQQHRRLKLCPFNNVSARCTKNSKLNPLGVCSLQGTNQPIIVCPVRFRENWRILHDVRPFLLPNAKVVSYVSEPSLQNSDGRTIGKIDFVLVEYNELGQVLDFAPLEVQSVYITGNLSTPFIRYIEDPHGQFEYARLGANYPKPDWLSSVKRTIHQITAKGMVLVNAWGKKMGIAVQREFLDSFPLFASIPEVNAQEANCAWYLYHLDRYGQSAGYELQLERIIYFRFSDFLNTFSSTQAGQMDRFVAVLEHKLQKKLYLKPDRPNKQVSDSQAGLFSALED